MIFSRIGKAGFVGGARTLIKGFFTTLYSATSAVVIPPDIAVSVMSFIQERGITVSSAIDSAGQSVSSPITATQGVLSRISSRGQSVNSAIDQTGLSVESKL